MLIYILKQDPTNVTLGADLKDEKDGIHIEGALVWLSHLHGLSQERMEELGLHKVSVVAVWEAIRMWVFNEKRSTIDELRTWFNSWYDATIDKAELEVETARLLAFPCQAFDHPVGFARVTKYLAYNNIGHVKERQPKSMRIKTFHLTPSDFVGECVYSS